MKLILLELEMQPPTKAKKRLDAIFKCGSANNVMKALENGKTNVGPIYDPSNFVESTETTNVYLYGLTFDYGPSDADFMFVFGNSEGYEAFNNYLQEKNCNYISEEDDIDEDEDEWLVSSCRDDIYNQSYQVWTLKDMKEMRESDLQDWAG